jgi:hypothetical protein
MADRVAGIGQPSASPLDTQAKADIAFNADFAAKAFALAGGFAQYGGEVPAALAFYGLAGCSQAISQVAKVDVPGFAVDTAADIVLDFLHVPAPLQVPTGIAVHNLLHLPHSE